MTQADARAVFALIRAALTDTAQPPEETVDWEAVFSVAAAHGVENLLCAGATRCGLPADLPALQTLTVQAQRYVLTAGRQDYWFGKVCAALETAGVDYLPLKGSVVRPLYPQPDWRAMGDLDILIREEQYDRIVPAMQAAGLTATTESDHELNWRTEQGNLLVELHKRIVPSYNKDFYAVFGTGWERAIPAGQPDAPHRYRLSDEDTYLFLFTHFAMHYRDKGIGLRHPVDLWVYRRAYPSMDGAYIAAQLEKLHLTAFHDNVMRTLAVWMEGAASDAVTDRITRTVLNSGQYGLYDNHLLSDSLKQGRLVSFKTARAKRIRMMLFTPYKPMCALYPFLEKAPVLLPVMWVYHWFDVLINRREHISRRNAERKMLTVDAIRAYEESLRAVGLDYFFDRDDGDRKDEEHE